MFLRRGPRIFLISIHAPREGGDGGYNDEVITHLDFNPRPPRGGRPGYQYEDLRLVVISIHAPREGGDKVGDQIMMQTDGISIHAPREGGDRGL